MYAILDRVILDFHCNNRKWNRHSSQMCTKEVRSAGGRRNVLICNKFYTGKNKEYIDQIDYEKRVFKVVCDHLSLSSCGNG